MPFALHNRDGNTRSFPQQFLKIKNYTISFGTAKTFNKFYIKHSAMLYAVFLPVSRELIYI
jgi:hypothetical protein